MAEISHGTPSRYGQGIYPINSPNHALRQNPFARPQYAFPEDLGSESQLPYVIFSIREGIGKQSGELGTIALHMPRTIVADYAANYEPVPMTYRQHAAGWYEGDIIPKTYEDLKNRVPRLISKLPFGDESYNDVADLWRRSIVNPQLAMIFKDVPFRTFSLDFVLIAKTPNESMLIHNIIYRFKYHMHPSVSGAQKRRFNYPNEFVIGFFSPLQQDVLFKVDTCVLTRCTVDYAGSGVPAFYRDTGAPVHINLHLEFTETKILTREDIQLGY